MIRGISPVNLPRNIYLRAVVISILVERGVMGSPILVLVFAVVISILVEWGASWVVLSSYGCLLWLPSVAWGRGSIPMGKEG